MCVRVCGGEEGKKHAMHDTLCPYALAWLTT